MKPLKKQLQLGHVLHIISDVNKQHHIQDGWTNQELIVNGIFALFEIPVAYPNYYVLAPQCSLYFNFNKNIPPKIRRFLTSQDKEVLLMKVARSLRTERPFLVSEVADRLFTFYKNVNRTTPPPRIFRKQGIFRETIPFIFRKKARGISSRSLLSRPCLLYQ